MVVYFATLTEAVVAEVQMVQLRESGSYTALMGLKLVLTDRRWLMIPQETSSSEIGILEQCVWIVLVIHQREVVFTVRYPMLQVSWWLHMLTLVSGLYLRELWIVIASILYPSVSFCCSGRSTNCNCQHVPPQFLWYFHCWGELATVWSVLLLWLGQLISQW